MTTLPAEIQEIYYNLEKSASPEDVQEIVRTFFEEYTNEEAERELWLLFSGALTSSHLPYNNLPEERKCMLHFYEYTKALLSAVSVLKDMWPKTTKTI
ncbi:hypothetical protein [Ferruginibacter sp. HRS2-29]|uniref:hypothetical protein n=1 Tax=Ferruginibacter sp. HRS2-29 TaxID=2487334 RepID=UPI0020CEF497|nr:hypothetical protein [Ferruginibacter sp. HRS2-29]MCP9750221.1 hypothetical protein [Ferruginibacter sp. HRS2-29]